MQTLSLPDARGIVKIQEADVVTLKNFYNVYGTKTDFERAKSIPRQSVINVLAKKCGQERIVKAVIEYFNESQQQETGQVATSGAG